MKYRNKYPHLTVYHSQQPVHPNAADNNYFATKALNVITAIVSGIGFTSAMLFLITLT